MKWFFLALALMLPVQANAVVQVYEAEDSGAFGYLAFTLYDLDFTKTYSFDIEVRNGDATLWEYIPAYNARYYSGFYEGQQNFYWDTVTLSRGCAPYSSTFGTTDLCQITGPTTKDGSLFYKATIYPTPEYNFCDQPNLIEHAQCQQQPLPWSYLFWDFAPLEEGGKVSYRITVSDVAPVPEPATWLSLITGFGMVGAAMRRRMPLTSPAS